MATEKGGVFNKRDGVLGGGEGSGNRGESAGRGQKRQGRREKKTPAFEEMVRKEEKDEGPYLQCGRGAGGGRSTVHSMIMSIFNERKREKYQSHHLERSVHCCANMQRLPLRLIIITVV